MTPRQTAEEIVRLWRDSGPLITAIEIAIEAERERCAKIVAGHLGADQIAAAIRAGEP